MNSASVGKTIPVPLRLTDLMYDQFLVLTSVKSAALPVSVVAKEDASTPTREIFNEKNMFSHIGR